MDDIYNGATLMAPRLLDYGVNFVTAILILLVGWWVSALLGRWVKRIAERSTRIDPTIVPMFYSAIVWTVRVFTLVAVLARFGVQTASLIAVLGAAGLAIGLALQGTLQNIAAGIMLLVLRPIRAGESVSLSSGTDGTVAEVGLFLTRLVQGDGINVTLPNSTVWNATITNFSRNPTRRLDMPVGIRYGDDLDRAIAVLQEVIAGHASVMAEPAPQIKVFEYRDNVVVVNIRLWAETGKFWDLRWDLFHQVRLALDAAGFRAPVPVQEVHGSTPRAAANAEPPALS
jgi:small conductance mechanosensitive channel